VTELRTSPDHTGELRRGEGRVEGIFVKRAHWGPMDSVAEAQLDAGAGIRGNANRGGRRQVTILEREIWEEIMATLGGTLHPSARRANFLVSGVRLADSRGKVLEIGGCRVRILGETKPCQRMEEQLAGLRAELYPGWRGGAFGEVLDDARVQVGDAVRWTAAAQDDLQPTG
jgi:MOSC domain-containing protein YiiM